jgi:hypothetical protein
MNVHLTLAPFGGSRAGATTPPALGVLRPAAAMRAGLLLLLYDMGGGARGVETEGSFARASV